MRETMKDDLPATKAEKVIRDLQPNSNKLKQKKL